MSPARLHGSPTFLLGHRAGDLRLTGVLGDGCLSVVWGAEDTPQICGLLVSLEPTDTVLALDSETTASRRTTLKAQQAGPGGVARCVLVDNSAPQ